MTVYSWSAELLKRRGTSSWSSSSAAWTVGSSQNCFIHWTCRTKLRSMRCLASTWCVSWSTRIGDQSKRSTWTRLAKCCQTNFPTSPLCRREMHYISYQVRANTPWIRQRLKQLVVLPRLPTKKSEVLEQIPQLRSKLTKRRPQLEDRMTRRLPQ